MIIHSQHEEVNLLIDGNCARSRTDVVAHALKTRVVVGGGCTRERRVLLAKAKEIVLDFNGPVLIEHMFKPRPDHVAPSGSRCASMKQTSTVSGFVNP